MSVCLCVPLVRSHNPGSHKPRLYPNIYVYPFTLFSHLPRHTTKMIEKVLLNWLGSVKWLKSSKMAERFSCLNWLGPGACSYSLGHFTILVILWESTSIFSPWSNMVTRLLSLSWVADTILTFWISKSEIQFKISKMTERFFWTDWDQQHSGIRSDIMLVISWSW